MLFSSITGPANICMPRSNVAGHGLSNSSLMSSTDATVESDVKPLLSTELTVLGEAPGVLLPVTRGVNSVGASVSFVMVGVAGD